MHVVMNSDKMIEFLKPNKSKFTLSLLILSIILIVNVLQTVASGYLKENAKKEFDQIMATEKYSELKQTFENVASTKPVEGDDISSLHYKYMAIDGILSILFSVMLSYLGGCFIFKKWNMLSS